MSPHNPADAFELYRSLGIHRTYRAVAERLEVSGYAIARLAKHERWQARLAKLERRERIARNRQLVKRLSDQQLRVMRAPLDLRTKKIELVSHYKIKSATDAIDLLLLSTYMERSIIFGRGEMADMLLDLVLLRMLRMGQIDSPTALSVLAPKGGAS
jgi:hypothetical protein